MPIQLEFSPERACPLEAKPTTDRNRASANLIRRDGVEGGSTRMALSIIAEKAQAGYCHVVDVGLKSYFYTISQETPSRVGGASGWRCTSHAPDPSLVKGGSHGGRQGDLS